MEGDWQPARELTQLRKDSDTRETLAWARRTVRERGLDDWLVVDVDAHHFERQSWAKVVECIAGEVVRDIAKSFGLSGKADDRPK